MTASRELQKDLDALIRLEEDKFKDAKRVLKERNTLREGVTGLLKEGGTLPEKSLYYARLEERNGRVPYRKVVDQLIADNPGLQSGADEIIQEYKDKKTHKPVYGRNQRDLFEKEE